MTVTMMTTEFGEFRTGSVVQVINRNFGKFGRPAVGIAESGGTVSAAYEDKAGTRWISNYSGGGWSTTLYRGEGYPGPFGMPWNQVDGVSAIDDNYVYYDSYNPYTEKRVRHNLGSACVTDFGNSIMERYSGSADLPDDPFGGSGNIEAWFFFGMASSGQFVGFYTVAVWYMDTWHTTYDPITHEANGGYWTRAYSVNNKHLDGGDMFPDHPQVYWNGPGASPGQEGIFIVGSHDIWERVPYNLGFTRIHKSSIPNFGAYLPYLRDSDQDGYYDFYNVGYPPPYMQLTWAFTGSGTNVVHGTQGSGAFFSKFYNYNGACYRAQLNGWASPDMLWCCPTYPRMVVMVVNDALISVTVPPPPADETESLMLSEGIYEDTPSRSPSEINPPVAYLDTQKVTRW